MDRIPKAVLDTSVLFPFGSRSRLLRAARERLFVAYWSPWIIGELYRRLTWEWCKRRPEDRRGCSQSSKKLMRLLSEVFYVVDPKPPLPAGWPNFKDVDDHPIWAAAKCAEADFVVCNNTRDYPPKDTEGRHRYEGIEYVTDQEFLQMIGYEETE